MKWIVPAAVSLMLVGSAGAQARVSSSASSGTVVKVVFSKQLEMPIVVAARGRTVYLLTSDTKGASHLRADRSRVPEALARRHEPRSARRGRRDQRPAARSRTRRR